MNERREEKEGMTIVKEEKHDFNDEGKSDDGFLETKQDEVRDFTALKLQVLDWINEDRVEHGCARLGFDALCSQAADEYCQELLENRSTEHYSQSTGDGPFERYYQIGCEDFVSEHIVGIEAEQGLTFASADEDGVRNLLRQAIEVLMENKQIDESDSMDLQPCDDILHESHTHFGIGIGVKDTSFRLVVVFVNRFVKMRSGSVLPISVTNPCIISGSLIDCPYVAEGGDKLNQDEESKVWPYACIVFFTPKQTAKETLGPVLHGEQVCVVWPWELGWNGGAKSFKFELNIAKALQDRGHTKIPEGSYRVALYVRQHIDTIPYDEPRAEVKLPDSSSICAGSIVLSFPSRLNQTSISTAPIESVMLLDPMNLYNMPAGYELSRVDTTDQTLPRLCFLRAKMFKSGLNDDDDSGMAFSNPVNGMKAVVELAVAYGDDDVPPGFQVVREANAETGKDSGRGANLCNFGKMEIANEEGKDRDEDIEDKAVYLCVRTSDDPVEVAARGVTQIMFTRDQVNRNQALEECYDAIEVFEGSLHVKYSLLSLENNREDGDQDEDNDGWDELTREDMGKAGSLKREDLDGDYLGECVLPTAESKRAELETEEKLAHHQRLDQMIQQAKEEHGKLSQKNNELQKRLAPLMYRNKAQDTQSRAHLMDTSNSSAIRSGGASQPEQEKNYSDSLKACNDAKNTLKRTQKAYDKVAMELQQQLDEKEAKVNDIRDAFTHFKREIAKAAENSRTGKPLPIRIIKQFEETEASKDAEVERVRLKNINLRTQLKKLENNLREKEQLAEGLHLIDFEQLKIENQTLNEKIEERNEELHKLRKKTTTTVQVLTHIKEKLQFVQAEVLKRKNELSAIDSKLTQRRDKLTKVKQHRDSLRAANEAARQDQGFANSTLLVTDFKQRKRQIVDMRRKLDDLKEKHAHLTSNSSPSTGNDRNPTTPTRIGPDISISFSLESLHSKKTNPTQKYPLPTERFE